MNSAIQAMLDKYHPINNKERENAIKEIIQEIVLAGLSRGGFFKKAAFYGGTCLRIFYGLNRFSEDLDFALIDKDSSFNLDYYFPYIKKELLAYGLDMEVISKDKSQENEIQTAFIKGNTLMLLMQFFPNSEESEQVIGNQKIRIKFEIDVDNPSGGHAEIKYQLLPSPYEIKVFDESTLFSGKIHAVICREYKQHVKGRDFYDYLFYCGKGAIINLTYLENKLKNSGKIKKDEKLSLEMVKKLLEDKFQKVNYELAKKDIINFVDDSNGLDLWSSDLFISTLGGLKAK